MPSPWKGGGTRGRYGVGFQVFQVRSFKIRGQELGGKESTEHKPAFHQKEVWGQGGKGGGGEGERAKKRSWDTGNII